jgi:hypothetical protein
LINLFLIFEFATRCHRTFGLQRLIMDLFSPFSRHQPLSSPGDCRYSQNVHVNQQEYSVDGPTTRTTYVISIKQLFCSRFRSTFSNFSILTARSPIVTGTSVLAIKFDGGVMMAADTLGAFD